MTVIANRRTLLLGLGCSLVAACTPGGRGDDRQLADRPSEGGVGGTGIVGTLTSASGLSVNGLALATSGDVSVRDAFGPRRLSDLAFGQALTVEAAEGSDGQLIARSVAVDYPLVGPIEAVDDGRVTVLGVEVAVEEGAPLIGPAGSTFQPAPGQRVAVSGLWRDDGVVATRLDLLEDADQGVVVAGELKPGASPSRPLIGGLELALPLGTTTPNLGSYVTAIGRRAGNTLVAERVAEGRFTGAAGPLERLSVEGYLEPIEQAPGYAVAGFGHSFDEAAKLTQLAGRRALYLGPYDGDFRVQLGLPLPENLAARDLLLAEVEDGFAPADAVSTR